MKDLSIVSPVKSLKYLFLICSLCFGTACNRYPDPSSEVLESFSLIFNTISGGRYLAGDDLNVPVSYINYNNFSAVPESLQVRFNIFSGGGTLAPESVYIGQNQSVLTQWRLGNGSFEQVLKASAYDASGNFLTSATLKEYGFRANQWDTLTGEYDSRITDMVADTINHLTLMITNSVVYRQGDRYFDWDEVTALNLVSPRTLDIDGNGIIYTSTWNGEVIKSNDHGQSWITCTKPYPDNPFYIFFYISNDNYLWTFKFDYPAKYSKDGGMTWLTAGSGFSAYGFGDLFRLSDGSILFHGSDCCSLLHSNDYGETWTKIETPGASVKLYVNDKDEIFICTQENGISIYKSADMGVSFQLVENVYPQFGTSMDNIFNKWKNYYYILIPGYGILKSADLVHYETYWINNDLNNLFIDHNGVLIAKDWNLNTVYYRKNSE